MDVKRLMAEVNAWVQAILKEHYVGVYFHGSLRLGSFNPDQSDLDFIIVVKEKIDSQVKRLLWDKMLENVALFPAKGFEFSVVLEENCKHIHHPIPYELHGSGDWIEEYKRNRSALINDDYKVDADLASHFHVINVLNEEMDFGKPSPMVFAQVPRADVIDSNYRDVLECAEKIAQNPTYGVLNLCRFYALVKEDVTLSKYAGGAWALEHMASAYPDVIALAMEDYKGGSAMSYNGKEERIQEFAQEAMERIRACMTIK